MSVNKKKRIKKVKIETGEKNKVRKFFKNLKTLVMMQLKEKIDLSYLKSPKQAITKVVFIILQFISITALCFGLFWICKFLKLFSFAGVVPTSVVAIVFSLMLVFSIIACTAGLMKSLYFANDNPILLTLPANSQTVYLSKLVVFYIYELIKNFSFFIPFFIAYGISSGFAVGFYFWLIFIAFFISMIPVFIGALLSIPAMWLYQLLKQYRVLQVIVYTLVISLSVFAVLKVISLIPVNIDIVADWSTTYYKIQNVLKWFKDNFTIFYNLTILIVGQTNNLQQILFSNFTLISSAWLVLVLDVSFVLGVLLAKPLFFKMASRPFEYRKRLINKTYKNKKKSKFLSSFTKEMKLNLRTPEEIYNNLYALALMPILIFLLNKIYAAMDTRMLGSYMTYSFNILIMLLILLSSNCAMASIYSREGRSAYLLKTQPANYEPLLVSKLIFKIIVDVVAIIVTMTLFYLSTSVTILNCILLGFGMLFITLAHLFWSAEMDVMNPQVEQYAAMGSHSKNPNETKSVVFAFIIALAFFAVSLFLFIEDAEICWIKLFVVGLIFFVFKIATYFAKIKYFYKEK